MRETAEASTCPNDATSTSLNALETVAIVLVERLKITEPVTSAAAVSTSVPSATAVVSSNAPRLSASSLFRLSSTAEFTSAISSTLVKSTDFTAPPPTELSAAVAAMTLARDLSATLEA